MSPLERVMITFGWVVGAKYDDGKPVGFRAVKGWHVINLDDNAEEAVTLRATTPEELLEKVRAFEANLTTVMEKAKGTSP